MNKRLFQDLLGKLSRAQFHLGQLINDVRAYFASDKYRIEVEVESGTGDQVIMLRVRQMPGVEGWAIRVGEIVYQIRSALDHSIERMTMKHLNRALERTQFPIFTFEHRTGRVGGFADLRTKGTRKGEPQPASGLDMIRGIDPDIQTIIETMQPYHRGNDLPNHPLWILSKLSNIDKHRALNVVLVVVISGSLELFPRMRQVSPNLWVGDEQGLMARIGGRYPFEPDTELARVAGDAEVKYSTTLHVEFAEGGPAGGLGSLETMNDLWACALGIVRTFEGLLGEPGP